MAQNQAPDADIIAPGQPVTVGTGLPRTDYVPITTTLANGDMAVVWRSAGSNPDSLENVNLQIVAPNGNPRTGVIIAGIANGDTGSASNPDIAVLSNGRLVITWDRLFDGSQNGIAARIFEPDGTPAGAQFQVNTAILASQIGPKVTALANGGFIVGWSDPSQGEGGATGDADQNAVKAQYFDAAGARVGGEILVNTDTAASQTLKAITTLANGNVLLVWEGFAIPGIGLPGNSADIRAQILSPTGGFVGGEFVVNANVAETQRSPEAVALANGNFAILWKTGDFDAGFRVFDAAGTPLGSETTIPTGISGIEGSADMVALPNGNVVVTWPGVGPNRGSIVAQIFSPSGVKIGGELSVGPTISSSAGAPPEIALLENGGFVIAWMTLTSTSTNKIVARTYDMDGVPQSAPFDVATNRGVLGEEGLTARLGGGFLIATSAGTLVFTSPAYNAFVEQPLNLKNTLFVSDADSAGGVETVTLSVSFGTLHLAAGTSGATIAGNDTASVTINGTLAQIRALLGSDSQSIVQYIVGSSTPPASATLTLSINDNGNGGTGGPLTASDVETITIKFDAAPQLIDGSTGTLTVVEPANNDFGSVVLDPLISVTDSDHGTLASATAQIGAGFTAGQDLLTVGSTPGGITASYNAATGTLTLTSAGATATLAEWQVALRSINYVNTSNNPSSAQRTVTVTVSDGIRNSNVVTETINVVPTNDPSILDLNGSAAGLNAAVQYPLKTAPVAVAPFATVADPDSPDFAGGALTVSITSGANAANRLSIIDHGAGSPQITVSGNAVRYQGVQIGTFTGGDGLNSLVISFNSAATAAGAEALARAIGFSNAVQSSGGAGPVVRMTLSDGDGATSAPATSTVTFSPTKSAFAQPSHWSDTAPAPNQPWYVGDFNGDGKDDVFRIVNGQSGADMHLSNGTAFVSAGSWTPAGAGVDGKWHVGDFNGDGRDDMFRYLPGSAGLDVFASEGSYFSHSGSWSNVTAGSDGKWYIGDFNGDGKDDVFRYGVNSSGADMLLSNGTSFTAAGSWTPAGFGLDNTWHIGDFNGDGKDDIFRYGVNGSGADMFLSTGTGFQHVGSWTAAGNGSDGTWHIADLNGDGKDDIFRYLAGISGAQAFLSDGTAFVQSGSWTGAGFGEGGWYTGDFNGDGTGDLLRVVPSGTDVLI